MADGMGGVALTDHGTMYGVKEFTNYIKKKNGKTKDAIKEAENAAKKHARKGMRRQLPKLRPRPRACAKKYSSPS